MFRPWYRLAFVMVVGLLPLSGGQCEPVTSPTSEVAFLTAIGTRVRSLDNEFIDGVHRYAGENFNDSRDLLTRAVGRMLCWNAPHADEPMVVTIETRQRDAYLQRLPSGELHVVRYVDRERENAITGRREMYKSLEFVPEDYCAVIAEDDAALRRLVEQARNQPPRPRPASGAVPTATTRCTSEWTASG